jgi:hypothetical protein
MAKKRFAARWNIDFLMAFSLAAAFAAGLVARAQTEDQAWLRYAGGQARSAAARWSSQPFRSFNAASPA